MSGLEKVITEAMHGATSRMPTGTVAPVLPFTVSSIQMVSWAGASRSISALRHLLRRCTTSGFRGRAGMLDVQQQQAGSTDVGAANAHPMSPRMDCGG